MTHCTPDDRPAICKASKVMMHQKLQRDIYLIQEGDAWFARNRAVLHSDRYDKDPVVTELRKAVFRPTAILEIGCSDGWRLARLSKEYRARAAGIDPSGQAIMQARSSFAGIDFRRGTADALPFEDARFDLVIYGFCLCCCDRKDLFRIVAEGDRVLKDGGLLTIYDFYVQKPHCRVNQHDKKLLTYKMNHAALFMCNPAYDLLSIEVITPETLGDPDDHTSAVVLMKKNVCESFPLRTTTI